MSGDAQGTPWLITLDGPGGSGKSTAAAVFQEVSLDLGLRMACVEPTRARTETDYLVLRDFSGPDPRLAPCKWALWLCYDLREKILAAARTHDVVLAIRGVPTALVNLSLDLDVPVATALEVFLRIPGVRELCPKSQAHVVLKADGKTLVTRLIARGCPGRFNDLKSISDPNAAARLVSGYESVVALRSELGAATGDCDYHVVVNDHHDLQEFRTRVARLAGDLLRRRR
jgi:thymidylate kinase